MPYAAETVAKSWEPGGRLLSTVVTRQAGHDAYGNVGTVEISTTAGGETFRKVTASTYRNLIDTNRWLLGRLTRAQVTHVDASGNSSVKTSAFTYYEGTHGLLQQEIIEPDSTAPGIRQTTTYEYDRFGNVTRTTVAGTDSAGRAISRSSQSAYTADGRFVQSATNALGHSERHTVDARFGELTEMTGPNAQTTRWDFDGFGRKTAERRADGTATLWERAWIAGDDAAAPPNAVYRLAQQDTAAADSGRLPPVVQYLDEKGRALRSVSTGFDGSATYQDIEYDTRGREVAKSLPYFAGDEPYWAETFYDDLDRVVRKVGETSRQVHVASLAYDGLKTTETDSLGRDKSTWTNAEGKVVAVQEEEGAFIEYDYDPRGNLIRTVQGDDHTGKTAETTIAYDQRDRKIAMQDADLGRWTYGYNSFGESEWQQDAVGNRTELVYDTLGRTVRRNDLPAGGTAQTTAWTFDSAPRGGGVWLGKLARIDGPAPGYRVDVSYDTLGRELTASQQTDGKTFTVANEYDSFGRVAATTQPGGFRIEHRYNASGFLVEQRTPAQPSVDGYDPAFVRSLLAETAVSATKALNAAAQYAEQAAWFQRKSAEYETVIRQLIQDQQLAPGAQTSAPPPSPCCATTPAPCICAPRPAPPPSVSTDSPRPAPAGRSRPSTAPPRPPCSPVSGPPATASISATSTPTAPATSSASPTAAATAPCPSATAPPPARPTRSPRAARICTATAPCRSSPTPRAPNTSPPPNTPSSSTAPSPPRWSPAAPGITGSPSTPAPPAGAWSPSTPRSGPPSPPRPSPTPAAASPSATSTTTARPTSAAWTATATRCSLPPAPTRAAQPSPRPAP